MISEKIFAKEYNSFWTEQTPWFRDYYSSISPRIRKIGKSIDYPEDSNHIFINNIISTTHFRNLSLDQDYTIDQSYADSIPVINIFSKPNNGNYFLTEDYRQIIKIQAERLQGRYSGSVIHSPFFPGCGLMANCNGDLLYGTTLVEIKARMEKQGRKPFRPEDFRQVLVYCALNYLANDNYDIQKIQLFNPRMGVYWESDLQEFIYLISNSTSSALFESIGSYLTEQPESIDLASGFSDSSF